MEPQRPSLPREIPGADDLPLPLPPTPPVIDTLPIPAADSDDDTEFLPPPRYHPRPRHQRSQNALLMGALSRRMSRQGQASVAQQHRRRQRDLSPATPSSSRQPPMLVADNEPASSMSMEIDPDEESANDLPASLPDWMLQRFSALSAPSFPVPTPPQPAIDPSVEARVLERLNSNAQSASNPTTQLPSRPDTPPNIEIEVDPTEGKPDDCLEADEGFSEEADDLPWPDEDIPTGSGIAGLLRSRGILPFTTSSEAALRCPKLVRNVPRMRKRKQKKKEHRLRAATGNNGESSQATTDTIDAAHTESTLAQ